MKAMILAAGRGERMRPLTDTCPKPLLDVGGKPLIAWHLLGLARAGVSEVIINHAHLGHLIEERLGDGSAYGLQIVYSAEGSALETAGGIRKALPWLGDEPFLVINGDVFTDWPIQHALSVCACWRTLPKAQRPLAHLVLVPNPNHNLQGDFALSPAGQVHSQPQEEGGRTLTFSGVGVYQPSLFEALPLNQPAKLAPLLRQAMTQGRVTGELHPAVWLDIGTPQRLNELNAQLLAGQPAGRP